MKKTKKPDLYNELFDKLIQKELSQVFTPSEKEKSNSDIFREIYGVEKKTLPKNIDKLVFDIFKKVKNKIKTPAMAKQFVLEEIRGASLGNKESQDFAVKSGFDISEYSEDVFESFPEIDGAEGPQQLLHFELVPYFTDEIIDEPVRIRINIINMVMKEYFLGKYKKINFNNKNIFLENNIKIEIFKEYSIYYSESEKTRYDRIDKGIYFSKNNKKYIEVFNDYVIIYILNIKHEKEFHKKINILSISDNLNEVSFPLVFTEGKTDWMHLKNSLNIFQSRGLYSELYVKFNEHTDTEMGDNELDGMVRTFSKKKHLNKNIFIFDRDNKKYIEKYGNSRFNNHGNNVFSFCIPEVNESLDEICIEHYYKNKDIKISDTKGRRLFLGEEFYDNGNSKCGNYVSSKRHCKKLDIIDNKVYDKNDIKWENNLALSKNDFTKLIIKNEGDFSNFDIENFKLIFEVLQEIVNYKKV